jgi:hypothetical protein
VKSARSLQRQGFAAGLFRFVVRVSNAVAAWPNRLTPPPFRLMQIGSAFWQSRALYAAAQLDLATTLGDAQLAAADLAGRVGAQPQALRRLLRMLAAMGVFTEISPAVYANNKLSNALRSERPDNVRAMILMHNSPEMSRPWFEQLTAGLRQGEVPFRLCHGHDMYAHMDAHPAFDRLFAEAMERVDALVGDSFVSGFDWGRFERIIDVGGSTGAKSVAILKRHPQLRALIVDRAQTIASAAAFWQGRDGAECLPRLSFQVGDVLSAVPTASSDKDIYLLSAVLHGFDDATAAQALRRLAAAAGPQDARIVLLELVLPEFRADLTGATFDMQMFMGTSGHERTLSEWQALFQQSGVRLVETVELASFGKLLVLEADLA